MLTKGPGGRSASASLTHLILLCEDHTCSGVHASSPQTTRPSGGLFPNWDRFGPAALGTVLVVGSPTLPVDTDNKARKLSH
jgi:hypothetical protein